MSENIYLIGFMGTGKSTVGKILADKLGRTFCDLDEMITEKSGKTITEIFDSVNEEGFRKLEAEVLKEVTENDNLVVSTGGGVVVTHGNLEMMQDKGKVITLMASAEAIFDRIKDDRGRPLMQVDNPFDEIKKLLFERASFYIKGDYVADTSEASPEETAEEIIGFLNENA